VQQKKPDKIAQGTLQLSCPFCLQLNAHLDFAQHPNGSSSGSRKSGKKLPLMKAESPASSASLTPSSNCRAKVVPRNENKMEDLMGLKAGEQLAAECAGVACGNLRLNVCNS